MFNYLKRILTQEPEKEINVESPPPSETENKENKLQVATAALYVEIATADGNFTDSERKKIINTMQKEFNLTNDCVKDLIELSEEVVKDSISVYEFTSVLNDHLSREEKRQLLNNLWKLVYTDGKLDKHEDRLIKIIGSTLNLDHKDVINAKLVVKQKMKGGVKS